MSTNNKLILFRNAQGWHAKYVGPHASEIVALFGTDTLPLPFTTQASAATAVSETARLNPDCLVVETEAGDAPVLSGKTPVLGMRERGLGKAQRKAGDDSEAELEDGTVCGCCDPGCPVHKGKSSCSNLAVCVVYRIDMEDRTGTPMCDGCANDALDSGVFTTRD